MSMALAVTGTLAGCTGCVACIELLLKSAHLPFKPFRDAPDAMDLATLCTFLAVSLEGLILQSRFLSVPQRIPTHAYLRVVLLFFIVNVANNASLHLDVSMPLFIVFKSGSLLANLVLGRVLRQHVYNIHQVFSVLVVTSGVVVFTLASYADTRPSMGERPAWTRFSPFPPFISGVLLLSVALSLSAYLGICQEDLYRTYGKHPEEAQFYVHALSLPAFALLGDSIWTAAKEASSSPWVTVAGFSLLPRNWVHILGICLLQNVYRLTALTSSLNVTMVTTLRKFLSLLLSTLVFGSTLNLFHVLGAFLVFSGSLLFSRA